MASPIEVRFVVAGTDQVGRAFDTIERRAQRFEQGQARAANDDVIRTRKTSDTKAREWAKLERDIEKWKRQEQQQAEKAAQAEVKATEKSTAAKLRAEEQWAKQRARIVENSAKMAFRMAEEEVRAVEKAERDKAALREKWARTTGRNISRYAGVAGSSISGVVGGATRLAGMALSVGGGFGISQALSGELEAQRAARQLINATTVSGPDSRANMANIMGRAGNTAALTGMSKADVLAGSIAYAQGAKGGDIGGALDNQEFFAKLAKVSHTSISDIGAAAGVLQSQNAELGKDPAKMRQMMLAAYAQTGSGSVSLSEAAKQIGTLSSTRGFYQGNEAMNQAKLMALGQLAAPGGSAEDIGTYVKDFSMEVAAKRRHTSKEIGLGGAGLESLGVHFDKSGRMESPEQAIEALFKITKGDISQLGGIVGKRGIPLLSQLQGDYLKAGGGDAGLDAIRKSMSSVTGSAMSEETLNAKFAEQMNDPAEKLSRTFESLKEKVGEALMPALERLANWLDRDDVQKDIQKLIDGLEKAIEWLGKNPWDGLGLVVAAAVTKDLAAAAIGDAVKKALLQSLGGGGGVPGGGGGGTPGAPVGAGSALGAAGGILGSLTAYAAYELGNAKGDKAKAQGAGAAGQGLAKASGWASYIGGPLGVATSYASDYAAEYIAGAVTGNKGGGAQPMGAPAQGGAVQNGGMVTDLVVLLKQIAENTKPGSAGDASNPTRNHPIGASRGATQ
jgi:hypothetical protein